MYKYIPVTALVFFAAILLSCSRYTPSPGTAPAGSDEPVNIGTAAISGSLETAILANVNAYRRSLGLASLQMVNAASQQAYNHSKNMATGRTAFSHDGFAQRVSAIEQTIGRSSASAENVAYGSLSAREVVNVWINSPAHRKNLEGTYNLTGIGTYRDRQGTIYFTQIFLRR